MPSYSPTCAHVIVTFDEELSIFNMYLFLLSLMLLADKSWYLVFVYAVSITGFEPAGCKSSLTWSRLYLIGSAFLSTGSNVVDDTLVIPSSTFSRSNSVLMTPEYSCHICILTLFAGSAAMLRRNGVDDVSFIACIRYDPFDLLINFHRCEPVPFPKYIWTFAPSVFPPSATSIAMCVISGTSTVFAGSQTVSYEDV